MCIRDRGSSGRGKLSSAEAAAVASADRAVEQEDHPANLAGSGVLIVHLQQATGLKAGDRNGLSDPYVKLTLGRQTKKSKTISKTLNPTWDEAFEFRGVLRELLATPLQLECYDADTFTSDFLGRADVHLAPLLQPAVGRRQAPVTVPLSLQGNLSVSYTHLTLPTTPYV